MTEDRIQQAAWCGKVHLTSPKFHHGFCVVCPACARSYAAIQKLLADEQADHEHCHDLVCNGNRKYPRGVTGHGCSCFSRAIRESTRAEHAEAQLAAMRAALELIRDHGDEDDEWDAVDRYQRVRDMATVALLTAPPQEPAR